MQKIYQFHKIIDFIVGFFILYISFFTNISICCNLARKKKAPEAASETFVNLIVNH